MIRLCIVFLIYDAMAPDRLLYLVESQENGRILIPGNHTAISNARRKPIYLKCFKNVIGTAKTQNLQIKYCRKKTNLLILLNLKRFNLLF